EGGRSVFGGSGTLLIRAEMDFNIPNATANCEPGQEAERPEPVCCRGAEPDGFFTAEKVVPFLRDLLKHLRGNVIVVWDPGNNHKGPVLRKFLRKNRRLHLEMLPPWAPDHNPVEGVWSWLKYGELANFTPADIPELDDAVIDRLIQLKFDPDLLRALW